MTEPNQNTFSAYVPIRKYEEKEDGTLLVFGRATQEILDSHKEIMDYESSVPLFRMRAEQNSERSGGTNLMPLRAMHQPVAAGKVVQFDFIDDEKAIDIVSHVVDSEECKKVRENVYTGFSVGGRYARRWADPSTGYSRFTADPGEVSLVDAPSVPTAKIQLFKVDFDKELPSEFAEWVDDFYKRVEAVRQMMDQDKSAHEERLQKLKTIGESVGIARRDGSPLNAPKDCPESESEYGDPANFSFLADEHRYGSSVERFNSGSELQKYSPKERHILGRRLSVLASRFGEEYEYLPEVFKLKRKEHSMSQDNKMEKLDVGALVTGLQAQARSSQALAATDPNAALASIMGYIDSLNVGQNITGDNVPVVDPSKPLKKSQPEPHAEPDGDEGPKVEVEVKKSDNEEEEKEDEGLEKSAAFQALKRDVEANNAVVQKLATSISTLVETLTKSAQPATPPAADPNSPMGALNSILQKQPNPDTDVFQHPAIVALEEGGPYALQKALKHVQDEGDINGSLAFQKLNDLIRKASYTSLEQGGIVTASAYQSRLYKSS